MNGIGNNKEDSDKTMLKRRGRTKIIDENPLSDSFSLALKDEVNLGLMPWSILRTRFSLIRHIVFLLRVDCSYSKAYNSLP